MNKVMDISTFTCNINSNGKNNSIVEGKTVYGLIKEKNEKGTLVEVMNRDILVSSSVDIKENVGETCSFTIEGAKGDKINLKYINRDSKINDNRKLGSFKNIWSKKCIYDQRNDGYDYFHTK